MLVRTNSRKLPRGNKKSFYYFSNFRNPSRWSECTRQGTDVGMSESVWVRRVPGRTGQVGESQGEYVVQRRVVSRKFVRNLYRKDSLYGRGGVSLGDFKVPKQVKGVKNRNSRLYLKSHSLTYF